MPVLRSLSYVSSIVERRGNRTFSIQHWHESLGDAQELNNRSAEANETSLVSEAASTANSTVNAYRATSAIVVLFHIETFEGNFSCETQLTKLINKLLIA